MKWFLKGIKQYRNYDGRARRKEFWLFHLYSILFASLLFITEHLILNTFTDYAYGPLSIIFTLGLIPASLALATRRLHDIKKSGALLTLMFLPIIGTLYLTILFSKEGHNEVNIYGHSPKFNTRQTTIYQHSPQDILAELGL